MPFERDPGDRPLAAELAQELVEPLAIGGGHPAGRRRVEDARVAAAQLRLGDEVREELDGVPGDHARRVAAGKLDRTQEELGALGRFGPDRGAQPGNVVVVGHASRLAVDADARPNLGERRRDADLLAPGQAAGDHDRRLRGDAPSVVERIAVAIEEEVQPRRRAEVDESDRPGRAGRQHAGSKRRCATDLVQLDRPPGKRPRDVVSEGGEEVEEVAPGGPARGRRGRDRWHVRRERVLDAFQEEVVDRGHEQVEPGDERHDLRLAGAAPRERAEERRLTPRRDVRELDERLRHVAEPRLAGASRRPPKGRPAYATGTSAPTRTGSRSSALQTGTVSSFESGV